MVVCALNQIPSGPGTSAPSCTAVKIFCATDTDRYARCALHAEASHVFFQKEDVFEQKECIPSLEEMRMRMVYLPLTANKSPSSFRA